MTGTTELDTDSAQDTHGMYARLRAEAPVHSAYHEEGVRAWLVIRDADALALLNGSRLIKDPSRPPARFAPDRARPYRARPPVDHTSVSTRARNSAGDFAKSTLMPTPARWSFMPRPLHRTEIQQ